MHPVENRKKKTGPTFGQIQVNVEVDVKQDGINCNGR